jgi:hypothetical protein
MAPEATITAEKLARLGAERLAGHSALLLRTQQQPWPISARFAHDLAMEQAELASSSSPLPSRLPWDFHPALTEERLRLCARMLANARRDVLAMASYELGDDPWSIGVGA